MIRQPDFAGVWIKFERAKLHFRDLHACYETFQEDQPYRVVVEDESDTGDLVHRVKLPDQPWPWWGAIVGDCVHNLRSSLDLLVCEMVRANGKRVTDKTAFPVFRSAESCARAFECGVPTKVKGAPKVAVDLIKQAKPYKEGDNSFWRLHQLDIADKHILLVPVGVAHQRTISTYTLD